MNNIIEYSEKVKQETLERANSELDKLFYCRVILKSHFKDTGPTPYMGYKNKTNPEWLPKDIHHSVKTFIESVNQDLQKETNETTPERKQNLTKGEIQSLHNLKERDDIIITKVDKGRQRWSRRDY